MSNYCTLNNNELRQAIQDLLEPRVLISEDKFANAIEQGRTALKIWKGIHALEREGVVTIDRLDELIFGLEDAVRNNDEVTLISIEKEVEMEILATVNETENVWSMKKKLSRGSGDRTGIVPNERLVLNDGVGVVDCEESVEAKFGKVQNVTGPRGRGGMILRTGPTQSWNSRSNIRMPVWKKILVRVLHKDGDRKISAFEKAICISFLAWTLAFLCCLVAVSFMSRAFVNANKNQSLQSEFLQAESQEMPRLVWCHIEDNIPAFFDPAREVTGDPLFAVGLFRNIEEANLPLLYPDTRKMFEEVIVAKGSKEEKQACMTRLKNFDLNFIKELDTRGGDEPTCRVCLRLRQNVSLLSTDPLNRPQASSNTGFLFQLNSPRLLTMCMRNDYKILADRPLHAALLDLGTHLKVMEKKGFLDLSETTPEDYLPGVGGTMRLFDKIRRRCGDLENPSFYTFVCNIRFFAGYFYPTLTGKQRWKYFKANTSFAPVGTTPYFKSRGERLPVKPGQLPISQQKPKPTAPPGSCHTPPTPTIQPDPPYVENNYHAPFAPFVTTYQMSNNTTGEAGEELFQADPLDILTRISAEQGMLLRLQREKDLDNTITFRTTKSLSTRSSRIRVAPERDKMGYFQYTLDLSFDNFWTQSFTFKTTFSKTEYVADVLNLLGIFLGVSVVAVLIVPASMWLIRSGTAKR